jgi:predicted flap endonuclease-1-like 5' DNA nuclease
MKQPQNLKQCIFHQQLMKYTSNDKSHLQCDVPTQRGYLRSTQRGYLRSNQRVTSTQKVTTPIKRVAAPTYARGHISEMSRNKYFIEWMNNVTSQKLQNIAGIGPKISKSIIASRPFVSEMDIMNVNLIGNKRFNSLKQEANKYYDMTYDIRDTSTKSHNKIKSKKSRNDYFIEWMNNATSQELQNICGIGPKISQAIIASRPFVSEMDIMNVNMIGNKRFNAFKQEANTHYDMKYK